MEYAIKPFLVMERSEYDTCILILNNLGLTLNESRVLLYLLISDSAQTASEVSRETGIQRTETYNYLEQLEHKGLIARLTTRPTGFKAIPLVTVIPQLRDHEISKVREAANHSDKFSEYVTNSTLKMRALRGVADRDEVESEIGIISGISALANKLDKLKRSGEAKSSIKSLLTEALDMRLEFEEVYEKRGDYMLNTSIQRKTIKLGQEPPAQFIILDDKRIFLLTETDEYSKYIKTLQSTTPELVKTYSYIWERF